MTLTVTNAKGTASTTQTNLVTVAANPPLLNAKFTADQTAGGAPLPVQFTDQSVGGATAGRGTSVTAPSPPRRIPHTSTQPTASTP